MDQLEETGVKEKPLQVLDYLQIVKNRWKEIFLTFLIIFAGAALFTFLQAPKYTSSTRFAIKMPESVIDLAPSAGQDSISKVTQTPTYLGSQIEVITSPETLKFVVQKLNLGKEWGVSDDMALSMLGTMVKVVPVKDTDMVDVFVTAKDSKLAQNMAEAVADAYRKRRGIEENEYLEIAIKKLTEALKQQEVDTENKLRRLKTFVERGNSNILDPGLQTKASVQEEELKSARAKVTELLQQEQDMGIHVDALNKLQDDQLLDYVVNANLLTDEGAGSSNLRELHKEYLEMKKERQTLRLQGYGPNHQKMKIFEESYAYLSNRLNDALVGLKSSLARKRDIIQKTRESWDERVKVKEVAMKQRVMEDQEFIFAKRDYDTSRERLDELEKRYFDETARLKVPRIPIIIYAHPTQANAPSSPNIPLYLAVGALGGLAIGILIAIMLERMDSTVKTMEQVEDLLGVPVMGVIPKGIGDVMQSEGVSPDLEAYRILRTNIELIRKNPDELSLAFVSGSAGEGKTTTLSNLSFACAQGGYTTLMIDADLRRSSLHKKFGIDASFGLSDFLTGEWDLEEVIQKTDHENLFILPAGATPLDPSGLLNSKKMLSLIMEAKRRFDIVLIDSPPILGVSDASVITSAVDMTIIVVQPRKIPAKALLKQKAVIEAAGGNLVGVVMNNVDISSDHSYQYYTTYYNYYSPEDASSVDKGKRTPSRSSKKHVAKDSRKPDQEHASASSSGEDLY